MPANRALLTFATVLTLSAFAQVSCADTLGDLYRRIKQAELAFPVPPPAKTITVGTLNGATGEFVPGPGIKRITLTGVRLATGRPPQRERPLTTSANTVDLSLRFQVSNGQGPIQLSVNGRTVQSVPGQTSVTLDVAGDNDFI